MPTFKPLEKDKIQELTRRGSAGGVDLTEYKGWVSQAFGSDGWGEVNLDASDSVRAIKRRITIAGKEINKVVKWHRKSTPTELIFQVFNSDAAPLKRNRTKKVKAD